MRSASYVTNTHVRKLVGFQKKYFWFGSEPVEIKSLESYLRGEKQEIANHNAAWSSQTGKGLLYFGKNASEKATPGGIINLVSLPRGLIFKHISIMPARQGPNFMFLSLLSMLKSCNTTYILHSLIYTKFGILLTSVILGGYW